MSYYDPDRASHPRQSWKTRVVSKMAPDGTFKLTPHEIRKRQCLARAKLSDQARKEKTVREMFTYAHPYPTAHSKHLLEVPEEKGIDLVLEIDDAKTPCSATIHKRMLISLDLISDGTPLKFSIPSQIRVKQELQKILNAHSKTIDRLVTACAIRDFEQKPGPAPNGPVSFPNHEYTSTIVDEPLEDGEISCTMDT